MITVTSTSIWDNFGVLYSPGGFNPALPLNNALIAVDDAGAPSFQITYNFTTIGTYYLVICSFKNDVTDAYEIIQQETVVLPVRLLSFTALKSRDNRNSIKWSTSGESNLSDYQLQHGVDGNTFSDIKDGRITSKNANITTTYDLLTISLVPGIITIG